MVHAQMKAHQCQICSRTFTQKKYLKAHFSRVHDQNKYFKCDYCNKSFGVKQDIITLKFFYFVSVFNFSFSLSG